MVKIPLKNNNRVAGVSLESRYAYEGGKKTDKIVGKNLVAFPLGGLADVMQPKGTIKIKLPNENFEISELQKVELDNLTVSPYILPNNHYIRYSYSADGFNPINSDVMD